MQATDSHKKSRHDRQDRIYLKGLDSMHVIMPFVMPRRADNEAVLDEVIDITAVNEYITLKNAQEGIDFKYTWFHVVAAAIAKVMVLRPKMNWFIGSDGRFYAHRNIEVSFNVKRTFADESEEAIAKIVIDKDGEAPIEQVHTYVRSFVNMVRKENKTEGATDKMNILCKLPHWMLRFVFWTLDRMEFHGRYPKSLMIDDPRYCSVYISNLGSIKMNADYHHLYEKGTVSFFCVINEKKMRPIYHADGTYEMKDTLKLGLTIDERIADGYYFAQSLRLLRVLLAQPSLLDDPINTPVQF